jgi:uncharacterized protein YutE (UPF0331/DUF86 family)
MAINGIISGKFKNLDAVVAELKSLGNVTVEQLENNWQVKRAAERDLQILVEIIIDVCQRILSFSGHQPAPTSAEVIEQCVKLGLIKPNPNYRLMVQFRNFIVHRYESVKSEILCDIINNKLDDFSALKDDIGAFFEKNKYK